MNENLAPQEAAQPHTVRSKRRASGALLAAAALSLLSIGLAQATIEFTPVQNFLCAAATFVSGPFGTLIAIIAFIVAVLASFFGRNGMGTIVKVAGIAAVFFFAVPILNGLTGGKLATNLTGCNIAVTSVPYTPSYVLSAADAPSVL